MAPRLRRPEMVERNRELVLDAARRVFIDKGYAGATLEAIAEEAGFSRGVMYSQFESKADLFLTLLERRANELGARFERAIADEAGVAAVRSVLQTGVEDLVIEAAWRTVVVEFRALTSREPSLNERYAAVHSRSVDDMASVLDRLWATAELKPPLPPRVAAEFILTLASGITLERTANPAALPSDVLFRIIESALGFTDPEHAICAADTGESLGEGRPRKRRNV